MHLRGNVRQARRQAELAPELVHLVQVVLEEEPRVQHLRRLQHLPRHVWIAVAIAADPAADGEEGWQRRQLGEREALLQRVLELVVEPRQLAQEGQLEIVDAVGDLVGDLQLGGAQHRGEPQAQHFGKDRLVALAARRLGEEPRDLALALEDALALHLGRVRGEHRAHMRAPEPLHQAFEADVLDLVEGVRQAAGTPRRAGLRMRAAPPMLLLVLGDIEEVREEAEGARHVHRLVEVERVEQAIELRLAPVFLAEADRRLADALDALERVAARLVADHLAEQPAEEAPVLAQQVFLVVGGNGNRSHRGG